MGSLEITMTIKCGECITHSNFSLRRYGIEDTLMLIETINRHHLGYFKAKKTNHNEINIECTQCGHVDELIL
ncbi:MULTISPECIES: hypothetical protein [Bacillus cereus group]|uniref:Uncharacterized protein n=1 Tax=Bacillus thuringiensis TaxID=1428 RepID=A0A9X7FXU8_BACTU|nr:MULTISPECIES: hypothetical protein [Bacillus cereus group]PFT50786.1 hypothetical protein COK72_01925 [Bacillus thuringiensis]PFY22823.1 hypothetical protein COL44_18245 [Bacillus toyonensis]